MKRRGVMDTLENRKMLTALGYSFTMSDKRKQVFIKVTNSDLSVIKEMLPDSKDS